eukprot:UN1678
MPVSFLISGSMMLACTVCSRGVCVRCHIIGSARKEALRLHAGDLGLEVAIELVEPDDVVLWLLEHGAGQEVGGIGHLHGTHADGNTADEPGRAGHALVLVLHSPVSHGRPCWAIHSACGKRLDIVCTRDARPFE